MTTALAEAKENSIAPTGVVVSMDTVQGFEALQRIAKLFTASEIVPPSYKGKDGLPNAVIAVDMAMRMRANPLMVMQNLYVVHNRPGWSAQFLIATFNKCGRFSSIRYEHQGTEGDDDWGCRAIAKELASGEIVKGPLVTIGLAKNEGWYDRKDKMGNYISKWRTMPEMMMRYRAASFLIRTVAPEIAMGLQTAEEVEDTVELEQMTDGTFAPKAEVVDDPFAQGRNSLPAKSAAKTIPEPDEQSSEPDEAPPADTTTAPDLPLDFKKAYSRLSVLYDERQRDIDNALFKNGASDDLIKLKDTTDPKAIQAVIKTAEQMKA